MSAVMNMSLDPILAFLAPVWMELSFVLFFALGFVVLRVDLIRKRPQTSPAKKIEVLQTKLHKTIEAEISAGNSAAAVKAWRAKKSFAATQMETLRLVVQAMLEVDATKLVTEITEHMADHREFLGNSRTAVAILDVVARAGHVSLMEELQKVFSDSFRIQQTVQVYEVLLGGYASAGDEKAVAEISSRLATGRLKVSARGYSLTIKGFLKNTMIDAALKQILDMHRAGFTVPSFAVTQLVRTSCEARRGMEIFSVLEAKVPIPPEAITLLLEDCLKHGDLSRARRVEHIARTQSGTLPLAPGGYDALLKVCVLHSDLHALELFTEMQKSGIRISEGLCVGLLARCAESKFLRFAEEIAKFVRGRHGMTIAVYSALMKVYAYAGMYGKACDLYDQITEQGMEPDSMMYGCLMKFSVECGRTDLSRELFSKAPSLDIQNYMSLIRAAGRDKDIDRAFQVLQKLKESNVTVDNAAYNCVLDVCVGVGDMSRARDLMAEMRRISKLDIITYNTFLKGFCSLGDIRGAKELLSEMESMGMHPNDVSFNCLINAAASRGMWHDAWSAIDMMERNGVPVDHYTISILMKALKKTKDSKQVNRALTLLDRAGLEVCSDEVLLNTVLETCIRHQQHQRLERVVDAFRRSSIQPSVHTYGSLIKACSNLKRADMCWELWRKMVDNRALEPNDIVLGCMLDALVCNQRIEEAVALFKTWQPTIPPNTIMYSTLIKGFANSRQPSKAMDMWREMQELRLPMNTVVYNSLIDSQARVGLMDEVGLLVQHMEPHGCTPDSITYSTIVKGYCYKGDLEKALEVLRNMQQQRMTNDSVVYNTLLDGCVRHNRMEMADTLLKDMEDFHIIPSNFTLGILVKMYGRRHQLDKAFEAVRELPRKYGFKANAQAKTCLMTACLNGADIDAAFKVFNELRSSEQSADWKTYNAMIFGCCRHGYVEQAVGLIEDAYGLNPGAKGLTSSHGQGLETDALQQLLRTLKEGGQMESLGVPLLNRLRAAQIPISMKLLSIFTIPQK